MSYREKSTWVTFVLLTTMFVLYFGKVGLELQGPLNLMSGAHFFLLLLILFVVIEIVSHILMAIYAPKDVKTPKDERELSIELRSFRPAYYFLVTGAFLSIMTLGLVQSVLGRTHIILGVFWIAELVRYGTQLYHYRKST